MGINVTKRIIPLSVYRQIIQNKLVGFQRCAICNIIIHSQIEFEEINGTHHQKSDIVLFIQLHLNLRLIVDKVGQKWQTQNRKQPLQITLPCRKNIRCLFTQRPIRRKADIATAQGKTIFGFVRIAIHLTKIQNATQSIGIIHRKCSRVKIHFFDKIHIQHPNRSAGTSLRLKVVDNWNLYPIEVKLVL